MSRERPILFNGDMVRAILDGRKTQTRRVMKPQPGNDNRIPWPGRKNIVINIRDDRVPQLCPYGQPGDRLWVRETWQPVNHPELKARYRADHLNPSSVSWKPSIHMPRWASRITLEVTDVRVERLQDISHEDAVTEGIEAMAFGHDLYRDYLNGDGRACAAIPSYASLWESINGPGSWDANPWVWVVEFRRLP